MLVQRQPNQAACLATSFAMVLDMPVQQVFEACGHDGMEIIFPTLHGAPKFRGFHIQEMVDLCLRRGYAMVEIEGKPIRREGNNTWVQPGNWEERFRTQLAQTYGVLIGETFGRGHAVAWDGFSHTLHDPAGQISIMETFSVRALLKLFLIR
jgi:hypothetical protein